jgi:integrase
MSDDIRVKVNSYGAGRALSLVYFDPVSGRKVAKSAGTTDWREAERQAGELERELLAGRYCPRSKLTWGQFIERYTQEKLPALRPRSRDHALQALNKLDSLYHPDRLAKVTTPLLSRFQADLRKAKLKDTTVAHYLRHVKAALRWAERQGILAKAPLIEMPKLPKGTSLARSRPVTAEEYERMLLAIPKVRKQDAREWERLITGVWLSGLRLGEAVTLAWDDGPFCIDLLGRRPAFRIRAEGQKSGRDEVLPVTPDFAEWLLGAFPEGERTGRVFKLLDLRTDRPKPVDAHYVGVIVGMIGRKAGVVTSKAGGKVKYAGLHDLRRAFCTRWASRVMPAVLRRLARHANIATTLAYYVDLDADAIGDELDKWAGKAPGTNGGGMGNKLAAGNISGNTTPENAHFSGGN